MRFFLVILFFASFFLSFHARADDETAKALLGSVLGIIATEALKEPSNDPSEEIQWNQPPQAQPNQISQISSEEIQRNKQIQAHLTRIGFYTNEIDGVAGPATTDAIISWETEFDQSIDGTLDDQEFQFLAELVSGGFTTQVDYESARANGFSTRKEYEAHKRAAGNASGHENVSENNTQNSEQNDHQGSSISILLRNAGQNHSEPIANTSDSKITVTDDETDSGIRIGLSVWIFLGLIAATLSYFLPTFIAFYRNHRNRLAILVLNIFAGWTGLVWIFTLVWSCTANIGSKEDPIYIRKG